MKTAAAADPLSSHLCRRLRQLRAGRGWSLDALATASGVSRSMLSQVERGQANPTLAVTFRIARAFGMSVGELVEAPGATTQVEVIRAKDRSYHYRSDRHCRIRTLSPLNLEKDVEFYEVQLKEGGALRSAAHYGGIESGRFRQLPRRRAARDRQHRQKPGARFSRRYLPLNLLSSAKARQEVPTGFFAA